MIKFDSERLKYLIIYYNNSKTQTKDYKNDIYNILVKNEGNIIMMIPKIYYTTVLLFINTKHNIFISVQYYESRYFPYKGDFLPEHNNYFIE
ncbi:MAG: hypothetical protein VZS44_08585 [Bacilli bacterium]|nr:hypothetical protein [Bacilli bacterium]